MVVVARRDGWHVTEHASSRPGTGQGQALRRLVAPALLQAADAHGVTVHASAANAGLARVYRGELPGLVDVGRGPLRGRRLQRPPVVSDAADRPS